MIEQSKGGNKLTFRNTVILSAIGSLFVFLVICYPVVGSPTSETVSASIGPIDLVGGVTCRVNCKFPVHLVPSNSTIDRGESTTFDIYIGTPVNVTISVFIPPPVNEVYWTSLDLDSIGDSLQIPIVTGISATLTIEPSTQLSLEGPASLSKTSITFNEVGPPERFTVSALSGASGGAKITVNADFHIDLHVDLSIDLPLFKQEIEDIPIREIPMNPTVSDGITVSFSTWEKLGAFVATPIILIGIFIFILILVFTIAMVIVAKRKRKTMETSSRTGHRAGEAKISNQADKKAQANREYRLLYSLWRATSSPCDVLTQMRKRDRIKLCARIFRF